MNRRRPVSHQPPSQPSTPSQPAEPSEPTEPELSGTITEAGSTTVQPLAEKLANAFTTMFPDVNITIQGGGAPASASSPPMTVPSISAAASRELKSSEPALMTHLLCRDGIAVVTDPDNSLSGLTMDRGTRYLRR